MIPVEAERVEALITEAPRLQRDPQHGVGRVVLAVLHLPGRQRRAGRILDEHASAVGQERDEGDPPHWSADGSALISWNMVG